MLRRCGVSSTSLNEDSDFVFRSKPIVEAEMSNRLIIFTGCFPISTVALLGSTLQVECLPVSLVNDHWVVFYGMIWLWSSSCCMFTSLSFYYIILCSNIIQHLQ